MNRTIRLRKAGIDDEDQLTTLAAAAHRTYLDFAPDFFTEFDTGEWRAKYRSMLNSNDFNIYIAVETAGKNICGFIILYTRITKSGIVRPQRRLVIDNLYVAQEFRRRGIARSLIQIALNISQEEQLDALELEVAPGNTAAQQLYAALGFDERSRTLALTVPKAEQKNRNT
jgi:ribosomal protein S18 acetylase RimI-like enzyme